MEVGAVTVSSIPAPGIEPPKVAEAPTALPASVVSGIAAKPPTMPATQQAAPAPAASTTSKKSKKKKQQPQVTMATATAATSGAPGAQGENTGRWTAEEHALFLQGLDQHGKGWKKIASLIKSRTVVQIRTHAQKYFQKLAKARQNGEEGEIAMEGRGGPSAVSSVTAVSMHTSKRRRQTTGTKRKAISSVVASAQRQGKRMASAQAAAGVANPKPPLPAVAPALAHFVPPSTLPSITTAHGTISGPALEDSLYVMTRDCCARRGVAHFLVDSVSLTHGVYFSLLSLQLPLPYSCSSNNGTTAGQRGGSTGWCKSNHGSLCRHHLWPTYSQR